MSLLAQTVSLCVHHCDRSSEIYVSTLKKEAANSTEALQFYHLQY
jgi:hypothetical protein